MPSQSRSSLSALTAVPHELQTQIYRQALPERWDLNIHPHNVGVKHVFRHRAAHSWSQSELSTSCGAETHPKNPSKALLLTCQTTRELAQPLLYAGYSGIVSICKDTIIHSDSLVPDVYVSNLVTLLRRFPWLDSKTHTLKLPLEQIRSLFADHLWDTLQFRPTDFLPHLRTIILNDDSYCYVSMYHGRGGIQHYSRFGQDDGRTAMDSFELRSLCYEVARRRFLSTLFHGLETDDHGSHGPGTHKLRWVKGKNSDQEYRSDLTVCYEVRFRVEDKQEQAYEARFTLHKWSRPEQNQEGYVFDDFGMRLSLSEVRQLTWEEDEECNWDEAAETDLTDLWSSDGDDHEYESDSYL